MNKEELIGKLQMVYVGDRNALNELIGYYDGLKEFVELLKKENQKYKEVIKKIKTRYIDYYGTTKEVNDNYVLRNVLKEISDLLKEVGNNE